MLKSEEPWHKHADCSIKLMLHAVRMAGWKMQNATNFTTLDGHSISLLALISKASAKLIIQDIQRNLATKRILAGCADLQNEHKDLIVKQGIWLEPLKHVLHTRGSRALSWTQKGEFR